MADIRSVKNSTQGASDEYVEQLRQKIGTDFTDRKPTGKKRNELGKDDFMKLMSAQLKNQDPINPMKNEEMAAQLAQFSALEQMMNVNQNLEKMTASQKPTEHAIAASLIGKRVGTDAAKFAFSKGSTPEMKFELPSDAQTVDVSVVDAKGEVIRSYELGAMQKGMQSIKWDGKNNKSLDQQEGDYSFRVTATDSQNKPVIVKTGTSGIVSGVVFEQGKAFLMVNDKKVALDTIGKIEADSPQAARDAQAEDLSQKGGMTNAAGASAKGVTQKSSNQNSLSVSENNEKNTQSTQNNLPNGVNPEMIKNMLAAQSAYGSAEAQNSSKEVAEVEDEGNGAYPLWNPSNNL